MNEVQIESAILGLANAQLAQHPLPCGGYGSSMTRAMLIDRATCDVADTVDRHPRLRAAVYSKGRELARNALKSAEDL